MDIKDLRQEIDKVNEKIVELFSERMDLAKQIADYKIENKLLKKL